LGHGDGCPETVTNEERTLCALPQFYQEEVKKASVLGILKISQKALGATNIVLWGGEGDRGLQKGWRGAKSPQAGSVERLRSYNESQEHKS